MIETLQAPTVEQLNAMYSAPAVGTPEAVGDGIYRSRNVTPGEEVTVEPVAEVMVERGVKVVTDLGYLAVGIASVAETSQAEDYKSFAVNKYVAARMAQINNDNFMAMLHRGEDDEAAATEAKKSKKSIWTLAA